MSEVGGYSFRYPSSYLITEQEQGFALIHQAGDIAGNDSISISYLAHEINTADDLLAWATLYDEYYDSGPFHEVKYGSVDLENLTIDKDSRQIYVESVDTSPVPLQAFLITNGRLVLRVATQVPLSDRSMLLQDLVQSIEFSVDAPKDLAQLYAPDPPPLVTSLEEYVEWVEGKKILQALNIRMQTGETPTDIIEQMSELEKQSYEIALEANAETLQEADRERAEPPPVDREYSELDHQQYLDSEREYNQHLDGSVAEYEEQPVDGKRSQTREFAPFSLIGAAGILANCSDIVPVAGLNARKGLPARYTSPVDANVGILCGSPFHTGADTYAADIQVGSNTSVRATTQNEQVIQVVNNFEGDGYGRYVRTQSYQYSAGISRQNIHIYAHLNATNVNFNDVLSPPDVIGMSGSTGTGGAHLHFAIRTGTAPVDLSPIKGLTPDLNYPAQCAPCGLIRNPHEEPIIIDVNEFTFPTFPTPVQPGETQMRWWACSTYYPNNTGTCYRAAMPVQDSNGNVFQWGVDPLYGNLGRTPKLKFEIWFPSPANYYTWVCAMGGNGQDDSLHLSSYNVPLVEPPFDTATRITGFHTNNWVWSRSRMGGQIAYLYYPGGINYLNVHARENGLRVDRILLTKDVHFNPTNSGIRCGAQNLYD